MLTIARVLVGDVRLLILGVRWPSLIGSCARRMAGKPRAALAAETR